MWTREELKLLGHRNFTTNYKSTVLICIVMMLLTGSFFQNLIELCVNFDSTPNFFQVALQQPNTRYFQLQFLLFITTCLNQLGLDSLFFIHETQTISILMTLSLVLIVSLIFQICVINPLVVGKNHFFIYSPLAKRQVKQLGFCFKNRTFCSVGFTLFYRQIKIFLWGLLLIIPGIIVYYETFMVPYLLAENPNMNTRRAFELSKQMTDNQKLDILMLDLSFIGWDILSTFTFGFLSLFYVTPYREATYAELYKTAREQALYYNLATSDELPGFTPKTY